MKLMNLLKNMDLKNTLDKWFDEQPQASAWGKRLKSDWLQPKFWKQLNFIDLYILAKALFAFDYCPPAKAGGNSYIPS